MILEWLRDNPSAIFLIVIAAAWFYLAAVGRIDKRVPVVALGGLACWTVSYLLNSAWTYFPREEQVLWWQIGLFNVAALYATARFALWRLEPADLLCLGVAAASLAFARLTGDRVISESLIILMVIVLCARCFLSVPKEEILARLVWMVLLVAEAFQLPQYLLCRSFDPYLSDGPFRDRWLEAETYACDRAFASPAFTHAPTIITGLLLVWFLYRWYLPRNGKSLR